METSVERQWTIPLLAQLPRSGTQQEERDAQSGSAVNFNGEGGLRREWWWQPGPVDSCCFCCSLRAGVGILASLDLLVGVYVLFFMENWLEGVMSKCVKAVEEMYNENCTGDIRDEDACNEFMHLDEQCKDMLELVTHQPRIVYLRGALMMMAGLTGLWAVIARSELAAKGYLICYPIMFALTLIVRYMESALMKTYGVESDGSNGYLGMSIELFLIVYYLKVLWSFHHRLKRAGSASSASSRGGGQIQLDDFEGA